MMCVVSLVIGLALGYFLTKTSLSLGIVFFSVFCAVVLTFGCTVWGLKKILRPAREAQSAAEELVTQYCPHLQIERNGEELEDLRKILRHLSSGLRERMSVLEGERAKVTTILDSMVEGVMSLDAQGRIVVLNPSARRIFDLVHEEVEARPFLEVIRNRELADFVEWCQSLTSTEPSGREITLTLPQRRVLEVNALPLDIADQKRGLVLVMHDITELRHLEQVRAEFVANVSHELRTPLTAIKGYLETLLDESSPDPVMYRRFLGVAHTHADRLGRLVNDLMNLSDIETGKIKLNYESVDLAEVVNEVAGIYQNEAEKKGVTLVNRIPLSIHVQADRDRLSQILINLVDNAVKYTTVAGEIGFAAAIRENNEQIVLRVQDSGQGIPPVDLPRITERFYRVDKARSREDGGTGLGLAIVKHLVHLHQGSIHINSEVGKGTTVEITLPIPLSNPTS